MSLPGVTGPDHVQMAFRVALLAIFLLTISCGKQSETGIIPAPTSTPQAVPVFSTHTFEAPLPTPFICDGAWQSLPVIPDVTAAARMLYQQGLARGNNAHAFSKIGDGEISTDWFLTAFDLGEEHYDLGNYQSLRSAIENFEGSFERRSLAARRGFNTDRILDSSRSDPALCSSEESPLGCELRIHNPSIAILSVGTNQVHRPEEFEAGMRAILDILLTGHVLPILSTKGDNLEGDHRINRMIACLAQEYQIPLWNFWRAIQPLRNEGLQPDLEHLTYSGTNDFDDPVALEYAWTVRNLTALQVLDKVWSSVNR